MTFYMNNRTALRFWCMVERSLDEATSPCAVREVVAAEASLLGVPGIFRVDSKGKRQVLHVLVGSANQRRKTANLVCHLRTRPYPKGAFRRFSNDILIASPELNFLEMAAELTFVEVVEYAFFLCGTYTLNPLARDLNGRQALSSKARLLQFADLMGAERGSAIVRKVLPLVAEGSASPRETKTTMLLCFPKRLGGYGFELPVLNYQINFSEMERRLFGKPHVILDLYWPKSGLGIEYDGADNHTEETDLSRDRRKSSELNYRGINVLRVDKDQLSNPYQVYVLAKKCARMMKKTLRKPTKDQTKRHRELFNAIMR